MFDSSKLIHYQQILRAKQSLIDHCYAGGRYASTIDYTKPSNPPLPDEERGWAREVLAAIANRPIL